MISPKQINKRFHGMLREKMNEYGRGFNKFLSLETGISTGYLSEILAGKKPGSQEKQIKICEALEVDYQSLFPDKQGIVTRSQSLKISSLEQHKCLLKEFDNQKLALEINQMLLQIEKSSPEKLESAKEILKAAFKPELTPIKKRQASNDNG